MARTYKSLAKSYNGKTHYKYLGLLEVPLRGSSSGVEHNLAKVGAAGSNPVSRSSYICGVLPACIARVVELVDTRDLKSLGRLAVPVQVRPRAPLTL